MTARNFITRPGSQFLPEGTGSVERTVNSKLRDFVSVLDFIPESEHAAIKDYTSTYDCSDAIQAAVVANGSVFFPGGLYNTTKTINLTTDAGVTKRVQLVGEGGCSSRTKIEFEPAVEGDAAIRCNIGSTKFEGFYLNGPGADNRNSPEVGIDFRKPDLTGGDSQQGTDIKDLLISNFGKAGLYFCQQWLMQINLCRIISCGQRNPSVLSRTGGVVFDPTNSGLSGWSSSGVSLYDCYFASCSYGIYGDSAWNLTTKNCIFEYCSFPYYRNASGSTHHMITPWLEANGTPIVSEGDMIIEGGRGVSVSGSSYQGTCLVRVDSGVSIERSGVKQFSLDPNGDVSLGDDKTGVVMNGSGIFSGTTDFKLRLNPITASAPGEYIACGPTYRVGNGLSKLLVCRHGYWNNSTEEVTSIGTETGSSAGGAGFGVGSLVFYTGSSGNGDGGSTATERARITNDGDVYVNTTTNIGPGTVKIAGGAFVDDGLVVGSGGVIAQDPVGGSESRFVRATSGAGSMGTASSIDLSNYITSTIRSLVGYVYAATRDSLGHRTRTWKVYGKPGSLTIVLDIDDSSSGGGSTPVLTLTESSPSVLTMTPSWAFNGAGYTWTIDLALACS